MPISQTENRSKTPSPSPAEDGSALGCWPSLREAASRPVVAASVADIAPVDPAADLIEACTRFSAIELRCNEIDNAARTLEQEDRAEVLTAELRGEADGERHWPALNRICTTPGSSHAAAIALASALAVWKTGAVVAGEDDPDDYVGDRITAALLRCLLGSASA